MNFLQGMDLGSVIIQFAVLLFSLSIHEAAHAWTADRLGDSTARYLGRVSLNPMAHIDLIGTVLFPLLQLVAHVPLIGWAKPVPINPLLLRNARRDQMMISLAGPAANLLAALAAFLVLLVMRLVSRDANGLILDMVQNGLPHERSALVPILGFVMFTLVINLALAVFNLLPVPPLDGHWMLYGVLPYNAAQILEKASSYGFLVLYGLMFLGMFRFVFIPVHWALTLLLLA